MEPVIRDDPEAQRFRALVDESEAGYAAYLRARSRIALMHTEVHDEFEGRGIAGKLAAYALGSARDEGLEVLPFCPFMLGYIEKHPEYVDLVPADERARFGL